MSLPKARLMRLEIQNFRGIGILLGLNVASSSHARPGWVLLVGENGTGKSSIVDALEYLVHGRLAHLKRQDVKELVSLRFHLDTESGLETVIRALWRVPGHSGPLEWSAFYPYDKSSDIPEVLQDIKLQCKARPFILRRAQILDFVNAKGADRRKQIANLLDLQEIEKIDQAWGKVKNEARKAAKQAQSEVKQLSQRLIQREEMVNQLLQDLGEVPLQKASPQTILRRLYQRQNQAQFAREREIARLQGVVDDLDDLQSRGQEALSRAKAWAEEAAKFQREAQAAAEVILMRLLENGLQWLEEKKPASCPLCGQPIEYETVLVHVREEHQRLAALKEQQEQLEQGRKTLVTQWAQFQAMCRSKQGTFPSEVGPTIEALCHETEGFHQALQKKLLQVPFEGMAQAFEVLQRNLDALKAQQEQLKGSLETLRKTLQSTSLSEQKQIERALKGLQEIVSLQSRLHEAQAKQARWQQRADFASKTHKAFLESRDEFLNDVLGQIEDLFNVYWERLHPEEGVKHAMVASAKKVGLTSKMQVGDEEKDGHPLTFLSEGHLDTLGLTIFLAFTKTFNQDLPFLVLDDVLTTVDHGHRQRVARLLAEEFADWHLILTTHDRLWGEQLRATAQAYGIPVTFYRMRPWDPITGVSVEPWDRDPWEYYCEIAEKMPALAIAGAGRELEKFLNLMRRMLRIAVPANLSDHYTIGELWDGFRSWVKKYWPKSIPEEWEESVPSNEDLLRELQEVETLWRMRNWSGAHYNEWADSVTSAEAKEFITAIERLVNRFRCPYEDEEGQRCKAFLKYDPNAKIIVCGKRGPAHFQIQAKR